MEYPLTNIRWLRIIVIAAIVVAISFLVITLITTGYAFTLAFEARGKPDQAAISMFSASLSRWFMPLLEAALTFFGALFFVKQPEKSISLSGLFLGVAVSLFTVAIKLAFRGEFNLLYLVYLAILIGLGFLGGLAGQRRINKRTTSPA